MAVFGPPGAAAFGPPMATSASFNKKSTHWSEKSSFFCWDAPPPSRRREFCHSDAPPSPFGRRYNMDGEGGVSKMAVSPTATAAAENEAGPALFH